MKYEKDFLEKLVMLRESYGNAKSIDEKTENENQIGKQLMNLNARRGFFAVPEEKKEDVNLDFSTET